MLWTMCLKHNEVVFNRQAASVDSIACDVESFVAYWFRGALGMRWGKYGFIDVHQLTQAGWSPFLGDLPL